VDGVGPGFLKYQKGMFGHIDEMKDLGFEWGNAPGIQPRPTTPSYGWPTWSGTASRPRSSTAAS